MYGEVLELTRDQYADSIQKVLDDNKHEVMTRLVDCVDIGYNGMLEYIPVCTIEGVDFEMGIQPIDYLEKLQITETYFVSIEDYEMCQRIADIRSRIL